MENNIKQQGTAASKLLPEIYKDLKQSGLAPLSIYTLELDENNSAMLNAGVGITIAAKGLTANVDGINLSTSDKSKYELRKTATFNSSSVFNAVMSLDSSKLSLLVAYVTSDSIHIQVCDLAVKDSFAIPLEIGDLQELKKQNLELLKGTQGHFFTTIDYGYGVGTFQSSKGGFAHVTTAYGDEAFYNISSDGAVSRDDDYVKPNEPYTVKLDASDIDNALDDIKALKVKNAGELIVSGSTGMITYTRAADSTELSVYFTDNRKDGKLAVLTFNVSNKTITASIV